MYLRMGGLLWPDRTKPMRHLLHTLLLALLSPVAVAQLNMGLVGTLDYQAIRQSNLSNLWGYTDETGIDYALVGVNGGPDAGTGGISVVSLEDPANPVEVFFFAGPNSIWREVKVWNHHAYITTEAESGGITIVDLSPLPQSTNLPAILWEAPDWTTSHSLFIDENGRLFIHGANRGNGGAIMYDLTQDPMAPVEVGSFDQWYCHDSFARGDTLYAAHIYDGFFSIVDVSYPAAPVLLGTRATPSNFTHNTWLDDSGRYLYTTDERPGSYIGAYDVSDPSDILEVDRLRSDEVNEAIIHNTYWKDHKLYHSYYTRGMAVYDATYPHNLVEVGNYDTSPFVGSGFNGAWGVYPFFESGLLIVSDIEAGLFVLSANIPAACWLEGLVTNAVSSAPVGNATISIVGIEASDITGVDGAYSTGYHSGGNYSVIASAPGYVSQLIDDVVLQNGVLTTLDIQLEPLQAFALSGTVRTQLAGTPVPNAVVELTSPTYSFLAQADANGDWTLPAVYADDYAYTAGAWGWVTGCGIINDLGVGSGPVELLLQQGYADDMALDLGWTVSGDATVGTWERGVPVGTTINNAQSNAGADVSGDCGDQAYVTGNGGGNAGDDDVDGGSTILTSPVFDATGVLQPHVRYKRWFFNGGGSGSPNDAMTISLSNGSQTVTVETITSATPGMSSWQQGDVAIASFLAPTATMRLIVTIGDEAPGHVVEGGLDDFELVHQGVNGIAERSEAEVAVIPNPNTGSFTVVVPDGEYAEIEVVDAMGRSVHRARNSGVRTEIDLDLEPGSYLVRMHHASGSVQQLRMLVVR